MPRTRTAPGEKAKDTGKVKAVILVDTYAYHKISGDPTSRRIEVDPEKGTTSVKGVEIEVSDQEFERGSTTAPPSLAKAGSKEAKQFFGDPEPVDPAAGYSDLSAADLAAIVTQRGGDPAGKNRDELLGLVVDAAKP